MLWSSETSAAPLPWYDLDHHCCVFFCAKSLVGLFLSYLVREGRWFIVIVLERYWSV